MINRVFDITSRDEVDLAHALGIAWNNCPGGSATHFLDIKLKRSTTYHFGKNPGEIVWHSDQYVRTDDGISTLILFWSADRDALELPYRLDLNEGIRFVSGWLRCKAEYGPQPDHDGHNEKGWRVFNETWGYVAGHQYAIVGIQPAWAMYGK